MRRGRVRERREVRHQKRDERNERVLQESLRKAVSRLERSLRVQEPAAELYEPDVRNSPGTSLLAALISK